MDPLLPIVKVWVHSDKSVRLTFFNAKGKKQNETEEQYINRCVNKLLRNNPECENFRSFNISTNEIPNAPWEKIRVGDSNNLIIDDGIKTKEEILTEGRQKARNELSVAGLSNESIDLILGTK